jgi:uncharacterized lipoprotein YmbA
MKRVFLRDSSEWRRTPDAKRIGVAFTRSARMRVGVSMLGASLVASMIAACAGPSSSESFFALNDGGVVIATTSPSAGSAGQATSALPGIIISAVTIPELIDRPQIVTRDSSNRVIVSEQNLWAESVKSGISRTLATRLARAMSDAGKPVQVAAYPQSSIAVPYLRITIDVVRFDAVPNGEAVVDALWSIRRPSDGMVRTGHTVASSPISGTKYEAIVGAWNEAVGAVDRDIAASVLEIGIPPPGATR